MNEGIFFFSLTYGFNVRTALRISYDLIFLKKMCRQCQENMCAHRYTLGRYVTYTIV